ncbi:hypothetical protein NST07_18010 [Paenibacillus sp. FSL L8-0340]|uniref:hypothetical protein n=1 Tax=Paenibacillus sp. FSL L8-0340 TaxID=2954685 RepID=UPI0031591DA0
MASLALEGLISQYELEQGKQDYYSKWILGNVFTSARQLAHSGGPLELVQNLLAESKAMYLAYHQVPADLRQRWWGNYKSYLAQQPQPETEKPKSWWEKMFEQYGENEILTAEAKRESAQLQMELAWDVAQGANETIKVNQSLGLYEQRDYHPNHPIAGKVGEIAGNVVSSLQGIGEFIAGAGGELFSVAVSSTGVLTLFGVLTGVASTGLMSHGGVLAYNGASNLGESSAELWQMMKGEWKPGATPPKSSSAKPEKPPKAEESGEVPQSKSSKPKEKPLEAEGTGGAKKTFGENGTQFESKTTWQNGKTERIDVENPNPGQRDGQIHYHEANNTKWYLDVENKEFYNQKTGEKAPSKIQKLLKDKDVQKAIDKGLKFLGEDNIFK